MGRANKRDPAMEAEVLERMAAGEPLAEICRSDPERFPIPSTWNEWCRNDPDLNIAHGRAREEGFDAIAAEALRISDDGTNDWMARREAREAKPESVTFNAEHVQRSKLRVETRLKLLAKWDPRRYGDKMALTDGDGKPLAGGATVNLSGLAPEQLRAIASAKLEGES